MRSIGSSFSPSSRACSSVARRRRSWFAVLAYGQGLSEAEIEAFVRARLNPPPAPTSSRRLRVGARLFHIAETIDPEWRLVLISDLSHRPAEE
jgi:hypothetical protein